MTQALALARFLRDAGHEVERVWVGRSPHRSVPGYFTGGIGAPVETFDAPVQVPDRHGLGASRAATALDAIRRAPAFARSARVLDKETRGLDVVVNFLDLVAAASRAVFRTPVPAVAVAHNYVFLGAGSRGLPGAFWTRHAVLAWTRATAAGSSARLALSFGAGETGEGAARTGAARARAAATPPGRSSGEAAAAVRTTASARSAGTPQLVPPLLRAGLDALPVADDGFLLAYALNPGYGDRLVRWQRANPAVRVRCFLDGGTRALREEPGEGFETHALDQELFLSSLARCRGYVGSAGFESICEAFHLGKPVLAVPTHGQYEQRLNAWDAERHGAARQGTYEDLDAFWAAPTAPEPAAVRAFRAWVARAPQIHVAAIERAARAEP